MFVIHYTVCMHICTALMVLSRINFPAYHDWSIMYNACTLLVKLLFSYKYEENNRKKSKNLDLLAEVQVQKVKVSNAVAN